MGNKYQTSKFYGNMDWFDVDDEVDEADLPESFKEAKLFWHKNPEINFAKIVELIKPFVRAWFVPAALSDSEEIFPDQSEFQASEIKVAGVDFSVGPFPLCKAEALFEVPVSNTFKNIDLESWQEDRGEYFYQAVSFGWEILSVVDGSPLVYTYGNNQGVECIPNVDMKF